MLVRSWPCMDYQALGWAFVSLFLFLVYIGVARRGRSASETHKSKKNSNRVFFNLLVTTSFPQIYAAGLIPKGVMTEPYFWMPSVQSNL